MPIQNRYTPKPARPNYKTQLKEMTNYFVSSDLRRIDVETMYFASVQHSPDADPNIVFVIPSSLIYCPLGPVSTCFIASLILDRSA